MNAAGACLMALLGCLAAVCRSCFRIKETPCHVLMAYPILTDEEVPHVALPNTVLLLQKKPRPQYSLTHCAVHRTILDLKDGV